MAEATDNNNRWFGESGERSVPAIQFNLIDVQSLATKRNVITTTPPLFNWVTCFLLLLVFYSFFLKNVQ
jgi:hypothetical protein